MYVYIYVYICAFILNYTCSILHLRVHLHTFTYTFTFTYIAVTYNTLHYTTLHYTTIQYNTIQYNTIHILFILGWHIRSSSLRQYTDDGFYIQDSKQQQRTLRLFSAFPFHRLVIFTHILVSRRQLTSAAHQIHTDSHLSTGTSNTLNKLAMWTWCFFPIQLTLVYLFVRVLPCRTWLLQNSLQGFGHRVRLPRLCLRHGVHSKAWRIFVWIKCCYHTFSPNLSISEIWYHLLGTSTLMSAWYECAWCNYFASCFSDS